MIAWSYFAFVSAGEWDKDRIIWRDRDGQAAGAWNFCVQQDARAMHVWDTVLHVWVPLHTNFEDEMIFSQLQ